MRIVNTFIYSGRKTFKAGELTVWWYMHYLRDPASALEEILLEYNDKLPNMSDIEMARFLRILFGQHDPLWEMLQKVKKPSKEMHDIHKEDFHIKVAWVARETNMDVINMPLEIFKKMLRDFDIITGHTKYDPKRFDKSPDRGALKKELWGTGVLSDK